MTLLSGNEKDSPPLRPPDTVMRLERLGSFHQTRISFVRTLMRKMMDEQWQIQCTRFDLDENGFGTCLYSIQATHNERYTLVLFSQFLDDSRRSDRVIADAWDVAFALCEGDLCDADIDELQENLPKQEVGRYQANVLVLSRANKSTRNFEHFVAKLADGQQPDPTIMARVGYLYRTTAVYGNGKFGIADYSKLQESQSFAYPFSAQMFTVYMLRHFSIQQVNFLAAQRNPERAVPLDERLCHYLGIGNSTGLGMAPFLVHHPKLIHQWILMRETAIARATHQGTITSTEIEHFQTLVQRAIVHVGEIYTDDQRQQTKNQQMREELVQVQLWVTEQNANNQRDLSMLWSQLRTHAASRWSYETEEMLHSILIELYPTLVDDLEQHLSAVEVHDLAPDMSLKSLKSLIECEYSWALTIDFTTAEAQHFFWYRSAEKEEPRIGVRGVDEGEEKEAQIGIGRAVYQCYNLVCEDLASFPEDHIIHFLLRHPQQKGIVRRIQATAHHPYGEIRDNLLGEACLPIHLLRCKLSYFGASKFDPKSSLWTRITLFQGAPLVSEIGKPFDDDWFLPTMPIL